MSSVARASKIEFSFSSENKHVQRLDKNEPIYMKIQKFKLERDRETRL